MRQQRFNEATFHEFVRSNVVMCTKTTYGDLNRLNDPDNHQLWNIANRMTAEIARAISTKTARFMVNVYERRKFHVETPLRGVQPLPLPRSLYDCVEDGILHIDRAARLILSKMHRQEFSEAVYYVRVYQIQYRSTR
ncbi:unnamed protein product [Cylicocyclus nassatus]|uniref:Uncharacterized protein n=1 Tax=Cylicocyclus nassatus TaxID=53992 RepID=A0AA36M9A7_CYLNA|nr:unnamed protein product [Cylicocyclus nassatus]